MDEDIPGNWTLTATGVFVDGKVARWTCPIEADAMGVRLNSEKRDCQFGPNSLDMTCYQRMSCIMAWTWKLTSSCQSGM